MITNAFLLGVSVPVAILMLSACSVSTAAKHHRKHDALHSKSTDHSTHHSQLKIVNAKVVRTKTLKTILVLDEEHNGETVLIVNAVPSASRHCWAHLQHWHCNRPKQ